MPSFLPAEILLPSEQIEKSNWAVIACDQFTSRPDYWQEVERLVGASPSTLHLIYPEVYLDTDTSTVHERKVGDIHTTMERYRREGILQPAVEDGYILVERDTQAGRRVGIIGKLDLESYDYKTDTKAKVRATEQTVESRIPTRMGIRRGAVLETPHIMMLLDDVDGIIDYIYRKKQDLRLLYDTELMLGGGRVAGYAIEGEMARRLADAFAKKEAESGLFLAAGDGNHSLAAAKARWEEEKSRKEDGNSSPGRYVLAEVVSIYSEALVFQPIHRLVRGNDPEELFSGFKNYLREEGIQAHVWKYTFNKEAMSDEKKEGSGTEDEADADIWMIFGGTSIAVHMKDTGGRLPVDPLQVFLDGYLKEHPKASIDYVHDEETVRRLAAEDGVCGFLLKAMDKGQLFTAIETGGVLPRKTFSIGTEIQKRYYMECRAL